MKYSKQRESIVNALGSGLNHPTAEHVYQYVRREQPSISLGTVYRNLNLLVAQGELRKIATPTSGDRFDIRTDSHSHLLCTKCGAVSDLEDADLAGLEHTIQERTGFLVTEQHVVLCGICAQCQEEPVIPQA